MNDRQGVQLLQKKRLGDGAQGSGLFFGVSCLALGLVAIVYGYLWWAVSSAEARIVEIDQSIAEIERTRDKQKEARLLMSYDQVTQLDPLLRSHVFMSAALQRLQALVQVQVQAISVNIDTQKKIIALKGVADNFTTISRQISSLYLDPSLLNVSLQKMTSLPNGRVDFELLIEFNDKVLLLRNIPSAVSSPTPSP